MNPMDEHLHALREVYDPQPESEPDGRFDAFLAVSFIALPILLCLFCVVGLGAAAWWVIR